VDSDEGSDFILGGLPGWEAVEVCPIMQTLGVWGLAQKNFKFR